MRPLRLTMTAFGPYAGTEVVDFDALTELGLFVVAGKNGSGKTTIFDALHYALFGMLPGRRSTYARLKSDHVDDSVECSVTFDFVAHSKHWRVVRSPKQQRAKRRGTGSTEAPATATLFRLDQGMATAITNRVEEVRAQCTELVGLSGKQFERVALLPQGQFSRVLSESSTERRELLRTLFSSEIFGDATALLGDEAAEATAADRSVLERLDHQQATLAQELGSLVGQPVTNMAPDLQAAIADFRQVELVALTSSVAELETNANQATHAHQGAVEIFQRMQRRDQVNQELARHQQAADQHDHDVARLRQARAAVPVTSNARSLAGHEQHLRSARERLADLLRRLNRSLAAAGLAEVPALDERRLRDTEQLVSALGDRLAERHSASLRIQDLDNLSKRVQAELRRLGNEIHLLTEQQEVAQAQLRQATSELTKLNGAADVDECENHLRHAQAELAQRTELADVEGTHGGAARRAIDFDATIDRLERSREAASNAQTSHLSLQQKADAALLTYEESIRRQEATGRYQMAAASLLQARTELDRTRTRSDQLWDAFIAGTAARVAQALVDHEPCPVCGSEQHPAPATYDSEGAPVTEADVAQARHQVDTVHTARRGIESVIENLRSRDADIASLSVTELSAEISTTKAMALGARTVADGALQAAVLYEQVTTELAQARADRNELDADLRALDQRRSHLQGALGETANEPVAALQARVDAASRARSEADQLAERRVELTALIAEAEQDVNTIGLGQIAADNRRASAEDQLVERRTELEQATSTLAAIDAALASFMEPSAMIDKNFELQAQAARHAQGLITESATAIALERDAADAVRRGQSILDERLAQSPFGSLDEAMAAYVDPEIIEQLEAQTGTHIATGERLQGQLQALDGLPEHTPDVSKLNRLAADEREAFAAANRSLITMSTNLDRIESDLGAIHHERETRQSTDLQTRRLERVAALVKGDNERNTSLENWVLAAHLRDVVELANIRLARSTQQRFQLCVLDDGENKRGTWGLDLGVEDTVTGTRRPTAGLSGGELFQASLALALGLADAVMNQSAGVRVDALFIDEGFGSLDETSVERAIDLLDELRDRGAMVGVITHVPALLDALPIGVNVIEAPNGQGSTIRQIRVAA